LLFEQLLSRSWSGRPRRNYLSLFEHPLRLSLLVHLLRPSFPEHRVSLSLLVHPLRPSFLEHRVRPSLPAHLLRFSPN
jgi:hypothetical protein